MKTVINKSNKCFSGTVILRRVCRNDCEIFWAFCLNIDNKKSLYYDYIMPLERVQKMTWDILVSSFMI